MNLQLTTARCFSSFILIAGDAFAAGHTTDRDTPSPSDHSLGHTPAAACTLSAHAPAEGIRTERHAAAVTAKLECRLVYGRQGSGVSGSAMAHQLGVEQFDHLDLALILLRTIVWHELHGTCR